MHEAETRKLIADTLGHFNVPNPDQAAASVFMELTTRALVADARVLRWCEWPDCFRSYHAMTGPDPVIDGKGWVRVRGGGDVLLCPDHANTGHRPQRPQWEPGWDYQHASCECGARGERVRPANLEATNGWWRDHVRDAAVPDPVADVPTGGPQVSDTGAVPDPTEEAS